MNVRSLLTKYNIHPKKRLGQNFLVAVPTLEKIVRHLGVTKEDKVLEIGPGPGVMTKMLADQAKFVAAIESDKEMVRLLEAEWGSLPNLHIIHGDILDTNIKKLLEGLTAPSPPEGRPWLFIGNIPYNITSPLLFHLRRFRTCFKYGLLTMQKEVADRLAASPGTKSYGILSIALQVISKVEKCFNISPSSFFPEPKVESTVVKISFERKPLYDIPDLDFFTTVVRAAFSTRRKKIKNALTQSRLLDMPPEKITQAIRDADISEDSRAEELDIAALARLARGMGPKA